MKDRRYKTKGKVNNLTYEPKLETWRKYYHTNHEYHLNRNRRYYLERMVKWYEWFAEEGYGECSQCGFDKHPKALDFHHVEDETKLFGIGKFINGRQCNEENKKLMKEELDKCVVLCANCHRIHHFLESNKH